MRVQNPLFRFLAVSLLSTTLLACDTAGSVDPELGVAVAPDAAEASLRRELSWAAAVHIRNTQTSFAVGETESLTAEVVSRRDRVLRKPRVLWSTSDPSVARISGGNELVAVAPGTAEVVATVEGRSDLVDRLAIEVKGAAITSIAVSPQTLELEVDESVMLNAVLTDELGDVRTDKSIAWTSRDPSVAPVGADGTVYAASAGSTWIVAESEGLADSTMVDVVSPPSSDPVASRMVLSDEAVSIELGGTHQVGAQVFDQFDVLMDGASVSWSSSDPAIVTVASDGTLTSHDDGEAVVYASSGDALAQVAVTVTLTPGVLVMDRSELSLSVGESMDLNATVRNIHDQPVGGARVDWVSRNAAVAAVSSHGWALGTVHAVSAGSTWIVATSGTGSDSNFVEVAGEVISDPVPTRIDLTPSANSLEMGESGSIDAQVFDQDDQPMDGATVSWSSGDPGAITVGSDGSLVSVGPGSAIITATAGAASAQITIAVTLTPATMSMSAESLTISVGETGALEASFANPYGHPVPGTSVSWSSRDAALASVDSDGSPSASVAGVSAGNTWVVASAAGLSDSTAVEVLPLPDRTPVATRITLSTGNVGLELGETRQVQATVFDQDDQVMAGASVDWSSSATGVVAVAADGTIEGRGVGQASVTATSGSASAAITIDVSATPAFLTLDRETLALSMGEGASINALVTNAYGFPVPGAEVAWSSRNAAVASVDGSGRVTGNAAGAATVDAASSGLSASVSVVVSEILPSDPGSNEPAGFVPVAGTERSFEEKDEANWRHWIRTGNADDYMVVDDQTGPRSRGRVGQMRFRPEAGLDGGEPATVPVMFDESDYADSVYVAAWVKLSPNWHGHRSHINKIFFVNVGSIGAISRFFVFFNGGDDGPLSLRAMTQGTRAADQQLLVPNTGGDATVRRGEWQFIETLVVRSHGTDFDGEVHLWLNGEKVAEYVGGISWAEPHEEQRFHRFEWTPVWGGYGDPEGFPETQYMWMDHVYISRSSGS